MGCCRREESSETRRPHKAHKITHKQDQVSERRCASAGSGAANDASSAGVTVTAGDAKVVVARNEISTYEANSIGASYKVSDALTVQAYTGTTEKSDTAAYEVKDTGVGLTYTITPGLTISVTNNDFTGKGGTAGAENGTRTVVALDATF